jgi:O-antigen/teichoic acid export membrane protein
MRALAAFTRPGIVWAYARTVVTGISSKLITGASGMAVVWLLNAILGKDGFAYCMIGLTLALTIAIVVVSGFEKVVIYHVSRLDPATEDAQSRRIGGAGVYGATGIAIALAVILFILADIIAGWMGKPEAGPWIRIFTPVIPLNVINAVQTGWIQARQMVPMSVFFGELLPNVLRVVLLALVWLLAGGILGIGSAVAAAFVIPVVWLFTLQPTPLVSPFAVFKKWDVRYGLTVLLTRLADQRLQSISVLLVGTLSTAAATAEFVLAVRFALLLVALQLVLNLLLVPRLGAMMARGSRESLLKEFDTTRFVALVGAIAGAIIYLLIAPFLLPLFGDYGAAYSSLMILTAGMVVRVGFGASGQYLVMAGHAGWRLLNSLGSLIVIVALSYLFVPWYGGDGAAMAAFLSMLFTNGTAAIIIWGKDNLATVTVNLLWAMGLACLILVAAGWGLLPSPLAAVCLSLIGIWILFFYRETWRPWLGRMLHRRRPA